MIPDAIVSLRGLIRVLLLTSDVAEANLPRGTNSPSVVAAEVHGKPADNHWHYGVGAAGDHEKGAVFQVLIMVNGDQNAKACNGDESAEHCEQEAVPQAVRKPSHHHRPDKSSGPWRHRVQLGLDWTVAVGLDNGRSKVCVAISRNNHTKVHEAAEEYLWVLEDIDHIFDADTLLECVFALVSAEPCRNIGTLFLGEPLCILGKVGK